MILKRLPTGMLASNCYIVGDNGEAVIIDPGVETRELVDEVGKLGLKIKYIILTHAHMDHICSMDEARDILAAQVLVHKDDAASLASEWYNGSALFGLNRKFRSADRELNDGDVLEVGGLRLEILHTPGHTPGSMCIKVEDNLFTGDTLFRLSVGRTDLGNGDSAALSRSLEKLMNLNDGMVVQPGHGPATTIGYERKNNPFIG